MSYRTSTNTAVPSFRFAPNVKRRIDQIRLYVDLVGVTLVRLFLPILQNPVGHGLLSIYNIAAWFTILTVDSTRIPEAATTRIMQRKSWRYALRLTPVLASAGAVLVFGFHQTIVPAALSVGKIVSIAFGSYFDEMLFRNILQPKLHQFGLSKWTAIGTQSALYACAIWIGHASLPIVLTFLVLGIINGWIVYRFRSLWAAFVLGLVWNVLWFA